MENRIWTVETRKMPPLHSSGRFGKPVAHVVLVSPTGKVFANTQIHSWTNVEAVKAKYQRVADGSH